MIFEPLLERLLQHYAANSYLPEVAEAKSEFFDHAGIVDQDSYQFDVRMAQFLDWYLFSRENSKTHLPPIQMALENPPIALTDDELGQLNQLVRTQHSLFEFDKIRGQDIFVKELFHAKKFVIRNSDVSAGFNHDEIFEARIIPLEDTYVFAKGFCFHPPEATKFILQEVKKVRHLDQSQKGALILRLMKMKYKHEQYRHIRLEYIYTNEAKLRM
jgi:hypothetical protein